MRLMHSRGAALLGGALLAMSLMAGPALAQAPENDPFAEARRRMEKMLERFERQPFGRLDPFEMPDGFRPLLGRRSGATEGRLGAVVSTPPEVLAEQLDLPKGQGLVLNDVGPNSPAGKAGMKKFDVLLELNGKAVPSKPAEFRKMLAEAPADKPLDAAVMRKGVKVAIKGLQLPEAKKLARPIDPFDVPFGGRFGLRLAPGLDGMTTIVRNNDQFTATQKSGALTVEVRGRVEDGKAVVEGVTVDDAGAKKNYSKVEDVPAEHRKRVQALADLVVGKKPAKKQLF